MTRSSIASLLASLALATAAFAGDTDKKTFAPLTPLDDSWRFSLSAPGWIPWLQGDSGLQGHTAHIDLAATSSRGSTWSPMCARRRTEGASACWANSST